MIVLLKNLQKMEQCIIFAVMKTVFFERHDMYPLASNAQFYLRHFVRGNWTIPDMSPRYHPILRMPVNRMFFPLRNPNRENNYIVDSKRKYMMEERHLYFIPAEYPVNIQVDSELYFLSLHFNLELYPGVDLFAYCRDMLDIPEPSCLEPLLELIDSTPEELPFSALKVKGLTEAYVADFGKYYPKDDFQELLMLGNYVPLLGYLKKEGDARTRVSDLSAQFGESREAFTRKFTAKTKLTPKALIDRILLGKAIELLRGNHSVKETASELRFSSEFVFSSFFKRCTGSSPFYWIRQMHQFH